MGVGKKWAQISKVLHGRTENSIKNRFNSLFLKARSALNMEMFPEVSIIAVLLQELERKMSETEGNLEA